MYVSDALRLHFPKASTQGIFGRIAVWNMAKIPVVITMGVWVADVAFLISGKYVLQITKEPLKPGDITGAVRVNILM